MKQIKLFSEKISREFGGSLAQDSGRRKVARPLAFSKPMHLVIKSSKAKRRLAFSPADQKTKFLIQKNGAEVWSENLFNGAELESYTFSYTCKK